MLAQGNDAFESAVNHLGLEPWRARVEQPDALPEHMLFPLYKAMTMLRILMQSARVRRELRGESTLSADNEQDFLREWVQEGASVREALGWFVHHAESQLGSLRWKHPEAALGYVKRNGRNP